MTRRENRGQQAALIVFAILNAILAVATFWFYRQYQYERKVARAEAATAARQHGLSLQAQAEIDELKSIIGHTSQADLDEVHAAHRDDGTRAVAGPGEAVLRPYRHLVETLWLTARSLVSRELASRQREELLSTALAGAEANQRLTAAQYEASQQTLDVRMIVERDAFADDRQRHEKQTRALGNLVDAKSRAVVEWQDSFRTMESRLQGKLVSLTRDYEQVVDRMREFEQVTFEKPDGEVTSSDGRSRRVFINLGSEDRLRVGLGFTVFPPRVGGLGDKPKGSIEVIHILAPHSAEARIVSDVLTDPILAGDIIYSPLWRPGKQRHFALVGPLDIDGDGRDDRELVATLIEQADGAIDEELEHTGTHRGKMTLETRFLVIGQVATERSASPAFLETYGQMIEAAERLAVERISLEKLLDLAGYRQRSPVTKEPTFTRPRQPSRR